MARGGGKTRSSQASTRGRTNRANVHDLRMLLARLDAASAQTGSSLDRPLPERRREHLAASGLGEQHLTPAAALILAAIVDGAIDRSAYAEFVSGSLDDGALVELLLPLRAATREPLPQRLRDAVFAHDGDRCCLAADGFGECWGPLHADHLLPVNAGGVAEGNLWTVCSRHNLAKMARFPSERLIGLWLASGRELPPVYRELLAARPWRETGMPAESWPDEAAARRFRERERQNSERLGRSRPRQKRRRR